MKTYCLFLSGVLFYFQVQYSYAQPSSQPAFSGKNLEDHMLVKAMDDLYYTPEEIEGTPYLNEAFVPGEIYGYKVMFTGVPMRYNILTDLIKLKRNDRL